MPKMPRWPRRQGNLVFLQLPRIVPYNAEVEELVFEKHGSSVFFVVGKTGKAVRIYRSLISSPPLESNMENKKIERDGNEEDDQKMEEFFALIRSFREARNRRREELREMEEMKKEKKKKKMRRSGGEEQSSSWIPTFLREDFTQEIEFQRPPMILASPCNKKKQPQDNLDLNLRL